MNGVRILNCEFAPLTIAGTVDWARDWIKSGERGYICTVNVAILMMMRSDPRLQRFVDRASLVVVDGQPLVWASHLQEDRLPERVTGVDLVDQLCALAADEGFGVYFLGARREVIETAANRLVERFPGLDVRGIARAARSSSSWAWACPDRNISSKTNGTISAWSSSSQWEAASK
jgi:N-acetylglucosaminyldiphosphoundecaprenol N-acetyl-beta-D-mannosaminyltransferase